MNKREYKRKWNEANRDTMVEYNRKWYKANRDKVLERRRQYKMKHPLYDTWRNMLVRTGIRSGADSYHKKNYIDRGITVCEEWRTYEDFEAWCFAHGWKPGLQLDRINNDGNYNPSNCRFVTTSQNVRNRRCTILVVYKGIQMPLVNAYESAHCHIEYEIVRQRISRYKWPVEKALTVPVATK